jgi:uncharacterized protein (TIGR03118 family)
MVDLRRISKRTYTPLIVALTLSATTLASAADSAYQQHNLVTDGFITADHTDANLVNSWGIAFNPTGAVWIANNHSGTSTLYDGAGNPVPLIVQIPGPITSADPGAPTGIVFNNTTGFPVTKGTAKAASAFIFATEQGTLAGWAFSIDSTHAITVVDNSKYGAIYKGLALGAGGNGSLLYATDFHNNKIDVFDNTFAPVKLSGKFADPYIPRGFAPFGIQAINGNIYVTFAKQDADREDDVQGRGLGFVDVFDPNGNLLRRVATRGALNAPWGLALAPAGFGKFSNRLLVGNFGDGIINAYDVATGQFVGRLRGKDHRPLVIDGLWGLAFGNGFAAQPVNTLFFTSGPSHEEHGLYGRINATSWDTYDLSPEREDEY